ncbi:MAG: Alginate biosynthesis sensor protein kinB [Oscillospiraceae bacterium]|jgi:anti-sigma regulatory factor (Ser/Thr protein kinase)
MLIIVLVLCVITSFCVALWRRDSLALYLLGMSVCNSVMLSGVIVYIAKMGGMAALNCVFLFLIPKIQTWLQYMPISMDKLGYYVAVGRSLFPMFALYTALDTTMIGVLRRRLKYIRLLVAILPVGSLIYYYPPLFRMLVRGRFWLLKPTIVFSFSWIVAYLLIAMILLVYEYRCISILMFKKNFQHVLLSFGSISLLYLLYASKDPAQIYNMFITEYIRLGIASYIRSTMPAVEWLILCLCTVFFVVLGSYNMVRYTRISYDDEQQDMILQRKFDAAGMGASVFVHGMKNQLLSSRVLHKKLTRTLSTEPVNIEDVRRYVGQLNELNEGMLQRMDELYRLIRESSISLRPVSLSLLVNAAVDRFHAKYPEQKITVEMLTQREVLADLGHLSEAVCNLLCNGYEAAVQAGRDEPQVILRLSGERMWTVIEVSDNGPGISNEMRNKIFEPFFTNKNTNYNWGMGLYYVRKIVKSHLGRIRLESRPGAGTSFFILLPRFDTCQKG